MARFVKVYAYIDGFNVYNGAVKSRPACNGWPAKDVRETSAC
jgi:hypothetical protein